MGSMEAYCEAGLEAIPERRSEQTNQWFERLLNDGISDLLKANATWAALYRAESARRLRRGHAATRCARMHQTIGKGTIVLAQAHLRGFHTL